jgi:endonuclease/exonuclease/phosphatase family metal-dependent hydrolase
MLKLRRPLVMVCSLAAAATGAACGDNLGAVALGGDDTDNFVLADTSGFAHIAAALDNSADLTLRDVFEQGDALTFSGAPNPAKLLTDTNALDDNRDRAGRAPLSVLTYNVALLDVDLFNVIPYTESPNIPQRRRVLPALIFETGADVVLLQELWLDEDVEHFSERAALAGYRAIVHDRSGGNDGLMICIREDIIAGGTSVDVDFAPYASQNGTEYWPGPGILRGWMSVRFVHDDIGGVHVFNTHMQAFPENWLGRVKQARELGIQIRTSVEQSGDFAFVGGDFNSGPYYKSASWTSPDASVFDGWYHNTIAYPALLTYGNLVDAAIMGRPAIDAIADITLGDTVVNDSKTALDVPGAVDGWCEQTPHTTFTATDCNSIYFDQYAGTESPARLDHVFVSDVNARVVVANSQIVFTEPQSFDDVVVEPSDHFGVRVDLLVTPK